MTGKGMQSVFATALIGLNKQDENRQKRGCPGSSSGKFMRYFKRRIGTRESRANAIEEYARAKEKCAERISSEIKRLKKAEREDEDALNLNSLVLLNKAKGNPLSHLDQDFLETEICCKKYLEKKDERRLRHVLGRLEASYAKLAAIRAKQMKYPEASEAYYSLARVQESLGKDNDISVANGKWNFAKSLAQTGGDASEPESSRNLGLAAENLECVFETFNKKGQWKVALKAGQEAVRAYENIGDYDKVAHLAAGLYDIASKNGAEISVIAYGLQKTCAEITRNFNKTNIFLS